MFDRRIGARALALGVAALAMFARMNDAAQAADPARSARDVIVRGKTDLADALRIATRPAWEGDTPRDVALIVDVTPYTARWDEVLVEALFQLDTDIAAASGVAGTWRIAPLGEPFGGVSKHRPTPYASALATWLPEVLARETDVTSTVQALGRTLRSLGGRDCVVVYLADWHFEDDHDLEGLVGTLRSGGHTLSVIGSEAAFGRGWNDGFADPMSAMRDHAPYVEGIGRNPFGDRSHDAPWHGGDTAYPHIPWRFGDPRWTTEFGTEPQLGRGWRGDVPRGPDGNSEMEDLRERLRTELPDEPGVMSRHPLPAAWGPYGLMRAASESGGRYVLWSWNPLGRSDLRYDYARCDLFPPDLRTRDAVRADVGRRDLPAAILRAWHNVTDRDVGTVTVTPPLAKNLRGAREMLIDNEQDGPPWGWRQAADRDEFVRRSEKAVRGLDGALADLDRAIASVAASPDDIELRYLADAHLFVHTLRAQRFALGEALDAAKSVPDDAWDEDDSLITLRSRTFLDAVRDPEDVRPLVEPRAETEIGSRLVDERKLLLGRYAGTPHGEIVARNPVESYEPQRRKTADSSKLGDLGRNPAQSSGTPGDPTKPGGRPPGGGSGGSGGSSTGR